MVSSLKQNEGQSLLLQGVSGRGPDDAGTLVTMRLMAVPGLAVSVCSQQLEVGKWGAGKVASRVGVKSVLIC